MEEPINMITLLASRQSHRASTQWNRISDPGNSGFIVRLCLLAAMLSAILAAQTQAPVSKLAPASGLSLASTINVQPGFGDLVTAPPSLLDKRTAEYTFGALVSRTAVAVQVTVSNRSPDFDLLLDQISIDFCDSSDRSEKIGAEQLPCTKPLSLASLDKGVLQGLADRGQAVDIRNIVLRIVEGVGIAAVPFPTFLHHIGPSFTPAVAAWNGPITGAYKAIFPTIP